MIIVDESGTITIVNAQSEKLFGYQREELIGQSIEMLIPERARRNHATHRATYTENPHVRPMGQGLELHGRRRDGTEFPVEISLSPLQTEQGTLISAAVRDITDRKAAERALERSREELARSNSELERYAHVLSRDLSAPLDTIASVAELLAPHDSTSASHEATAHVQRILEATMAMRTLIDDPLAKSRADKSTLERGLADLGTTEAAAALDLAPDTV
jgi:PAS domain S-box-containing protein